MNNSKPIFPTLGTRHCVPTPESERLRAAYLFHRNYRGSPAIPARHALRRARVEVDNGETLSAPRYSETRARRDADGMAWIEAPKRAGLRFVGYADELASLSHRGWFTDDEIQDDVARGAVYQLPARNGCAQYVPAMLDPHNDGPALFDFSNIHVGERDENGYANNDLFSAHRDCARAADSIAENYAEKEREYQAAWRAGTDYADKGEEMAPLRRKIRAQVQAIREHGGPGEAFIRASFADTLCGLWEDLQTLREERATLKAENDNPHDRDAFNDGAGIA